MSQHYDTKNGTFTARFTEMRHLDTLWKGNETYIHEEADPFEVYTRVPTPPISSYYPGSSRFAIALSSHPGWRNEMIISARLNDKRGMT